LAGKVADAAIDSNGQNWIPYGKGPAARWFGYGPMDQKLDSQLSLSQQQMQQAIDAKGFGPAPNVAFSEFGNQIGPVTKQQIGLLGDVYAGNAGGRPSMNMPTMAPVQAQAPWQGSLGGTNPFGGSYGSNLGFSAPQARSYGRAAGSFTPFGAGAIQVAGQGWAGSDAAAGFGLGAQGAGSSSAGSIALADAMRATKKNR